MRAIVDSTAGAIRTGFAVLPWAALVVLAASYVFTVTNSSLDGECKARVLELSPNRPLGLFIQTGSMDAVVASEVVEVCH